jgi:hypothetical protein
MGCGDPLASTILVPELQAWFNSFVSGSSINKNEVPLPVDIPDVYLTPNSFIALLFNNDYDAVLYPTYKYLYKEESISCWPNIVKNRIMIYPASARYLIIDDEGSNVFTLGADDFSLLDALLSYREDSTGVTIVDSVTTYFDSTSNILYATYGNLTTVLSKLIFLYLDLKINDNYANYNNSTLVSDGTVLESLYEMYVMDKYFDFMTLREPDITTFD